MIMRTYTLKINKKRFFYPKEWLKFISIINNEEHKFMFEFLLHTGMRFNEARNVEVSDIDFDRETLFVRKPKGKGKQRTIQISTFFKNRIQSYLKNKGIKHGPCIIFKTGRVPTIQFADKYIKKYCQAASLADFKDFSCHNIRKTLENWLIALNINTMAIVSHIGHNIDTAQGFYVASQLMNSEDKVLIKSILDNLLTK
jgi:integrase